MTTVTGKKALLVWCQDATAGYANVRVTNFTSSWHDGLAFCAILHRYRPHLIDFNSLNKQDIRKNLELAFQVAESLGISRLLDIEDVADFESPDNFAITTYLSQYYQTFANTRPVTPPKDIDQPTEHINGNNNGTSTPPDLAVEEVSNGNDHVETPKIEKAQDSNKAQVAVPSETSKTTQPPIATSIQAAPVADAVNQTKEVQKAETGVEKAAEPALPTATPSVVSNEPPKPLPQARPVAAQASQIAKPSTSSASSSKPQQQPASLARSSLPATTKPQPSHAADAASQRLAARRATAPARSTARPTAGVVRPTPQRPVATKPSTKLEPVAVLPVIIESPAASTDQLASLPPPDAILEPLLLRPRPAANRPPAAAVAAAAAARPARTTIAISRVPTIRGEPATTASTKPTPTTPSASRHAPPPPTASSLVTNPPHRPVQPTTPTRRVVAAPAVRTPVRAVRPYVHPAPVRPTPVVSAQAPRTPTVARTPTATRTPAASSTPGRSTATATQRSRPAAVSKDTTIHVNGHSADSNLDIEDVDALAASDELALMQARLLQWNYINAAAEASFSQRKRDADSKLSNLFRLIMEKKEHVHEASVTAAINERTAALNSAIDEQSKPLSSLDELLPKLQNDYASLASALVATLDRLPVGNIRLEDIDQAINVLQDCGDIASAIVEASNDTKTLEPLSSAANEACDAMTLLVTTLRDCHALVVELHSLELLERSLHLQVHQTKQHKQPAAEINPV